MVGFTAEDWWDHFDGECRSLGKLYCFVATPTQQTDSTP